MVQEAGVPYATILGSLGVYAVNLATGAVQMVPTQATSHSVRAFQRDGRGYMLVGPGTVTDCDRASGRPYGWFSV